MYMGIYGWKFPNLHNDLWRLIPKFADVFMYMRYDTSRFFSPLGAKVFTIGPFEVFWENLRFDNIGPQK